MQIAKKSEAIKPQQLVTITFPDARKKRARKVVTRSRARATGKFPSRKMNRMLQWESIHELNAFRLLEVNPEVKFFQEQPCEIHYVMDGEHRVHYPDILVKTEHNKEFWEIKSEFEAKRPETTARTKLLTSALPDLGYQYRVVLGEDLARKIRLYNIKSLLAYGQDDVPRLLREKARQIFAQIPDMTIEQLIAGTVGEINRKHVYRLIVEGELLCDIESQLSPKTALKHITNQEQK
jgi:hypothetical protein